MFIRQVLILITVLILSMPVYAVAYEHEIKSISSSISDSIAKSGKKRIAVVDFTDLQGNVTELGRFLAEELSIDLTNTARGFVLIDRTHLKTLLKEHKLSISGLVDPATAKKLGQIAGVDAIVTGSVTPLGKSVKVSCKVIATDTAMVIGASKVDIARTRAIDELLGKGIDPDSHDASQTKPSTTAPRVFARTEAMGYVFEAKGCKDSGGFVTCAVSVTNRTGVEKVLSLNATEGNIGPFRYYKTYLYDERGNEYLASGSGTWIFWMKRFVPDVPVNVGISFEGMSIAQSKNVTLVVGGVDHRERSGIASGKEFSVTLRNVPVIR